MTKKLNSHDVQKAAFKNVSNDFNQAVTVGRKKYIKMVSDFASGDQSIRMDASQMKQSLLALRFLEKAAKGEYHPQATTSNYRLGARIWEDYLDDIGALHHGFGCAHRNDDEVEKRMRQNGPKKMEQRLTKFLQRRVKQSVAKIGQPGGLVLD